MGQNFINGVVERYLMKINLSFYVSHNNIFRETRYNKYLIQICSTRQNYMHSMVERYHMKTNLFLYVLHMNCFCNVVVSYNLF
jgi:protein gp37